MIGVVKELKTQMLELMKASKEALKVKPNNSEGIRKQAEETQKVSQAEKNLIALEKERVRLLNKLNQSAEKQAKNNARLKVQQQQRNKQLKDQARAELGLVSAYDRQAKTLNTLRKRYKDLLIAGKGNTKEAKRLAEQVGRLDKKLKAVDKSAGQYQRNVGNYGSALKAGFGNLMSAVGVTAGITGVVRGLRSAINVVTDFDSSIANLGAVSQASDEDLEALRKNALALGETTKFTASEVADLSLELAKLGFKPDEIIKSSKAILDLSAATGQDLAESAKITGQTLRAFNLDVEESGRVASVLGVATTKSALDMEFFNTAMSKVAPVAASLGFELEDTTALLGTLANSGFDASTAATSTKNILLKLADSGGELAQALGRPVKNLDDLIPALKELAGQGIDLSEALELTDKRSVAAFNTFLKGTDTLEELREGITDVNQELADMAEKQLDTVNGQLALLNSKWQAMILGTSDSAGAVNGLKSAIAFLTRNLDTILKVLKFVVIAFVSYKTAVIAQNVALTAYNLITKGARIATLLFSGATKRAAVGMRGLNTAIKSNPLGLLISLLTTAIALLWDYGDAADEQVESIDRLSDAYERLKQEQSAYFKEIEFTQSKAIALIDLEIAKAKERGASDAELHKLKLKRIDEELKANLYKDGRAYDKLLEFVKLRDEAQETFNKDSASLTFYNKLLNSETSTYNTRKQAKEQIKFFSQRLKNSKLTLDNAQKNVDEQQALLDGLSEEAELLKINSKIKISNLNTTKKGNKARKVTNKFAADLLELKKEELSLERNIEKAVRDKLILNKENNIKDLTQAGIERASDPEVVDFDQDGEIDLDFYDDRVFTDLKEGFTQLYFQRKFQLDEALAYENKVEERNTQALKNKYKSQLDNRQLTKKQYDALIIKADDNLTEALKLNQINYDAKIKKVNEDRVTGYEKAEKEIIDAAQTTADKQLQIAENTEAEKLARLSDTIQATNALLDFFQRQNDARAQRQIDNINKEIEASKNRYNELKQLSINGNVDAEKSALAEERIQQEQELKRQKVQRNQQLFNAGIAAFKVFAAKVESGDKAPLSSTIKDITSLTAFIQTLPTFYEGTEDVGSSLGKPDLAGRDGHIVRVDSAERIVDPSNNAKMAGLTNSELGDLALDYKNKSLNGIKYNKLSPSTFESVANSLAVNYHLSSKLDEINRSNNKIISAIEHIPHESWDYDKMSDAVIQKIKTQKKTEIIHYNNKSLF
jgi:TP901 family phage tail tape measure protein